MWTYKGEFADITTIKVTFTTSHDLPQVSPRFQDSTVAKQRQIVVILGHFHFVYLGKPLRAISSYLIL